MKRARLNCGDEPAKRERKKDPINKLKLRERGADS